MAKTPLKKKSSLKSSAFTILGSLVLVVGFVVVFLITNNIDISLGTKSASEKYPAEAFVKKRTGKKVSSAQSRGTSKASVTSIGITTNEGLTANVGFDKSDQKVTLSVLDHNDKPMGRLQIVAHISKIGSKSGLQPVRMIEHSVGNFGSESLDLKEGGWILMVSAYNYFNSGYNTLLFHSEQPIFLNDKKKQS